MKRMIMSVALVAACALAPRPAHAWIRGMPADDNPMVEIERSTVAGALTGLTLGLAVANATPATDNDGDIIRVGFVAGTLVGFVVGLNRAAGHSPSAMIEAGAGGARLHVPVPQLDRDGAVRVPLVGTRF